MADLLPYLEAAAGRFHAKVDKSGECWIWTGAKISAGYGVFKLANKLVKAHRASWALANNSEPGAKQVCHRCDNPSCVNPAHLFLGTASDNMRDMVAKGRSDQRGSANNRSKLTEQQVRAIRVDSRRLREIADDYGVCVTTICAVRSGQNWGAVPHSFAPVTEGRPQDHA